MRQAAYVPCLRTISTSLALREQGDKVMLMSPYLERANMNPMDKYQSMQGPLHDYGSWVLSGMLPPNMSL